MYRLLHKIADVYDNIKSDELYKINDSNAHVNLSISAELQREKAFIYFNDNIYVGVNHITAINKINNLSNKKKRLLYMYRLKRGTALNNIKDKISFGHILKGNIAVIDSYTNLNCNNEDIKNALLAKNYSKIYAGYTSTVAVTRN